jgi:hypothetical protein
MGLFSICNPFKTNNIPTVNEQETKKESLLPGANVLNSKESASQKVEAKSLTDESDYYHIPSPNESGVECTTHDERPSPKSAGSDPDLVIMTKSYKDVMNARELAERGPRLLQVAALLGGIAMVFSSIKDFYDAHLGGMPTPAFTLISFYSWLFGGLVVILEGRIVQFVVPPVHRVVTNYFKALRFLWGRGVFYVFVGSLQFSLVRDFSTISGTYMMILGVSSASVGATLHMSLLNICEDTQDETHVNAMFELIDTDHDGYIGKDGFRDFVLSTGLIEESDVDYNFLSIDTDGDRRITRKELKNWVGVEEFRSRTVLAGSYEDYDENGCEPNNHAIV